VNVVIDSYRLPGCGGTCEWLDAAYGKWRHNGMQRDYRKLENILRR